MDNNLKIYLLGGNSVIGNAILKGVQKRHVNKNIETFSFVRNNYEGNTSENIIKVSDYIDSKNYIDNGNKDTEKILIISFGVLKEEKSDRLIENLQFHLNVNTFKTLELLNEFINNKNIIEIHVVSSILGDFIRPSIFSYSVSKNFLELLIENTKEIDKYRNKLYVWKPAHVESKLNENRKPSFLRTNPNKITKIVSKKNIGGNYYIPPISIFFTNIAKISGPLVRWLDKKI